MACGDAVRISCGQKREADSGGSCCQNDTVRWFEVVWVEARSTSAPALPFTPREPDPRAGSVRLLQQLWVGVDRAGKESMVDGLLVQIPAPTVKLFKVPLYKSLNPKLLPMGMPAATLWYMNVWVYKARFTCRHLKWFFYFEYWKALQ